MSVSRPSARTKSELPVSPSSESGQGLLAANPNGGGVPPLTTPPQSSVRKPCAGSAGSPAALGGGLGQFEDRGGEDTVVLSIRVTWSRWASFGATLHQAKSLAQEMDTPCPVPAEDPEVGFPLIVRQNGTKAKGGGPFYCYLYEIGGAKVQLMNRADPPSGQTPNMCVTIGSVALIALGLDEMWKRVAAHIDCEGGEIESVKVSRMDFCIDLVDVPVNGFNELFQNEQYITRARKTGIYYTENPDRWESGQFRDGRRCTGFKMGGEIMLRIYDKAYEVRKDERKLEHMIEKRWGGRMPETATRVEFQLRRESLKSLGIDTLSDWMENKGGVIRYLVERWVRFVEPFDKNHYDLAKVHPLWERVASSMIRVADGTDSEPAKRTQRAKKPVSAQLTSMVLGCLTSMAAMSGKQLETVQDLMLFSVDHVSLQIMARGQGLMTSFKMKLGEEWAQVPLEEFERWAYMRKPEGTTDSLETGRVF